MKTTYETPKITVAIRKRPLNKKELARNETDIVTVNSDSTVVVCQYKQKVDLTKYIEQTTFAFDHAFDQHTTNQQIFDCSIRPLIHSAFQGAKISCFAYGQTGSGKTHTMKGDLSKGVPGMYFLGASQIFDYLQLPQHSRLKVSVCFYEIYCGKLFDLLNNRNQLKIRQDKNQNINVIGTEEKNIKSAQQFIDLIQYGSNFRITSQNATNAQSSRSHAILQIVLKDGKKTFSKISFIDLAGNQRGADHIDQNKQTRIDGAEINKSLLSLKQCIRALDQGKSHTPFRGSKLTMVLKDSFVGFCKTVMIGNVSPNSSSSENTMNTLRYADRVKQLKKPSQGVSTKQETLAKQLMLPRNNKNVVKVTIDKNDDQQDILLKRQLAKKQQQSKKTMDIQENNEKKVFRKADNIIQDIKPFTKNQNVDRKSMVFDRQVGFGKQRKVPEISGQNMLGSHQNLTKNNFINTVQPVQKQIHLPMSIVPHKNNLLQHSKSNQHVTYKGHVFSVHNRGSYKEQNYTQLQIQNQYAHPQKMEIDENNSQIPNHNQDYYYGKISEPQYKNHSQLHYNIQPQYNNYYERPAFQGNHSFTPFYNQNHYIEQQQLQRTHSSLQNELHKDYDSFLSEYSQLIKEQTIIIRNEMQNIQTNGNTNNFNNDKNIAFMKLVENSIDKKLAILTGLRSQVSVLRDRMYEFQDASKKVKAITDNYGHDQQLLQGLPGQQNFGRLF